jgi:hypothetical protein
LEGRPNGPGLAGQALPLARRPLWLSTFSTTLLFWIEVAPALLLYKRTPCGEKEIQKLEEISCVETSLSLSVVRLPEGLRWSEENFTTTRRRAARITDLIETYLVPQSQSDQRSGGHRRSSYVCEYSETLPFGVP